MEPGWYIPDWKRNATPPPFRFHRRRRRPRLNARVPDSLKWTLRAVRMRARRFLSSWSEGGTPPPRGINLAGYFRGSLGLGESARLLARSLSRSDIPLDCIGIPLDRDSQDPGLALTEAFRHSVTVLHVNPPNVAAFIKRFRNRPLGRRRLVGLWYWELEELPASWRTMSSLFDEVWVASEWSRGHLAAQLRCPIHSFPFPLDAMAVDAGGAQAPLPFAIPGDRYLFLNVFDYHSSYDRKNPEAALAAYLRSFPEDPGRAFLVLKSLNASHAPEKHARMLRLAEGRPDILVVDADLPKPSMDALYARADCFLSLHRSEGLGLGFLQALRNGKAALLTDYAAPAEFRGLPGLHLVPFRLVPIETDFGAYQRLGVWADPDIEAAAETIRRLVDEPRGAAAPSGDPRFTCAAFNAFVAGRLDALHPVR